MDPLYQAPQTYDAPASLHIEHPNDNLIIVQSDKDSEIKYSYVFLHGLLQNGGTILEKIQSGEFLLLDNVRYLLPHAPIKFNELLNKDTW